MGRREESRRQADQKRTREKLWRRLYSTVRWKRMRRNKLSKTPWCEPCQAQGMSRVATVVNHKEPHRGDLRLFFHGELESCCENCHNSAIQRAEKKGFRLDLDEEGWPIDPAHPFQKQEVARAALLAKKNIPR